LLGKIHLGKGGRQKKNKIKKRKGKERIQIIKTYDAKGGHQSSESLVKAISMNTKWGK